MLTALALAFFLGGAIAQLPATPAGAAPTAPEEDIRGSRPAIIIPVREKPPIGYLIAAAATMAVVAGLVLTYRRRRIRRLSPSPLEQAREALRDIDAERTTLEAGVLAERTASVVRHFIAGNFGIAAPQRTTEEFFRSLADNSNSPLLAHAELLQGFLKSCDAAKFAGAEFDGVERFALLETAGRFVQAAAYTVPSASPPAPSVPSQTP